MNAKDSVADDHAPGDERDPEAPADRRHRQDVIRADAAARDERAEARDVVADRRDEAASLDSFLSGDGYAKQLRARRSAAQDRLDSKSDRHSAADDREQLSDDAPGQQSPS